MCKRPLKGFKYGTTKNGKDNYVIREYSVDHLEILPNGKMINVYDAHIIDRKSKRIFDHIEIPCGKCIECQLKYSRIWADRCMLEAKYHDENCFITLTYDEDNVPFTVAEDIPVYNVDGKLIGYDHFVPHNPITGEVQNYNTLLKPHMQLFMKRLRQELNKIPEDKRSGSKRFYKKGDDEFKEVRFLLCGEYGSKHSRPHYHVLLFGWFPPEDDIQPAGKNELGQDYWQSKTISKVWPYGLHVVGKCDWNSCAYVSRYVTKKMFPLEKDFYNVCGAEPEFILMSRRPGIGAQWYEDHKECYSTFLNQYIATQEGSHKIGSIRYFDNKLVNDFPKAYEDIRERRVRFAQYSASAKKLQTSLPYLDYLSVEEENMKKKTKILKGGLL